MVHMGFGFFAVNLVIALIASLVLHFVLDVKVRGGIVSYLSSLTLAWLGAWLGPPVFGDWFAGLETAGVYWIPALLGSFAILILAVDCVKTCRADVASEGPSKGAAETGPGGAGTF